MTHSVGDLESALSQGDVGIVAALGEVLSQRQQKRDRRHLESGEGISVEGMSHVAKSYERHQREEQGIEEPRNRDSFGQKQKEVSGLPNRLQWDEDVVDQHQVDYELKSARWLH